MYYLELFASHVFFSHMDSLPDSSFTLHSVIPRILFMQNICLLCMQTAPSQTNAYIIAKCIFAQFSFRPVMKNGRPHVKTISTRNNYLEEQFRNLTAREHDTRQIERILLLKFTRSSGAVVVYHGL